MLIIDRTQRTWATLSAVVCVVAGAVYFCYASWSANGPSGGSVMGLMFGSIAAVMMIFAGLLAARRRFPSARIGSAQFWMKGHLWIGTLTVPFALFHAGFGLGGRVEILLWILFFVVILSGFWGLLLQQMLPRMMFENLPRETFLEQIPHLCNRFTAESDCRLAEVCGPLEVTLSPVELKQFAVHWQPHFEEDRKKNRNDYPKTASDTEHFQKFLTKVYVGIPLSAAPQPAEVPQGAAASAATPVMKSVAQVKAPDVAPAATATSEAPVAHPKPDPRALLAAAKAKAAGAGTAAVATVKTPASDGSSPVTTIPAAAATKPDPRAMLAAAKARKALEGTAVGSAESSPSDAESAPAAAKPDPQALLAAARAKKAAAEAATATPESTAPPPVEHPATAAPAKPDPKAILAAARAKKAAAAAEQTTSESTAAEPTVPIATAPAKPDPKAMLAAAKAKREAAAAALAPAVDLTPEHTATVSPASVEPTSDSTKPKADPRAMLAAAKAKREAAAATAAATTAPTTPVSESHPVPEATDAIPALQAPAGKPDPKAMMAAMKARKEAAAQQAGTSPAVAPTTAKANPLAQLKTVKEPPAVTMPTLATAAKVAPPTAVQIKELKLFYLELIRPQLPLQPNTQSWRDAIRRSIMVCQIRSDNQHPQFIPIFDYLLDLCEQRRQFAMVQRYHAWLHGWLLVHIPVTVALYVVLLVHAIVALRVIPFGN